MNDNKPQNSSRRNFIRNGSLVAAGITIVPRHVLGRGFIAPSDKLKTGSMGAGGQGDREMPSFFN